MSYGYTNSGFLTHKYLDSYNNFDKCFPAHTKIQLADGTEKPISDITTADEVAAFHPSQFAGRGGLSAQPVVRLFENITDVWVQLSNGITVTPGHHFLDAKGGFRTIADILATNSEIVLADGTIAAVTGEYIHSVIPAIIPHSVGDMGAGTNENTDYRKAA